MAKRTVKEKEITEFLHAAGLREVREADKTTTWYKKAARKPSCLKTTHKEKIHN